MRLLALILNIILFPFVLRLFVDFFRQGSIFSYIVVEVVWLCKFLCLIESYMLTVISYPLGSLVVKRILCRLDGWTINQFIPERVKLQFRVFLWVLLFAIGTFF